MFGRDLFLGIVILIGIPIPLRRGILIPQKMRGMAIPLGID
jgi:hypothetical protein